MSASRDHSRGNRRARPGGILASDVLCHRAETPPEDSWRLHSCHRARFARDGSFNNIITIDLLGTYDVSIVTIQHDNNDGYQVDSRDFGGVWHPIGTAGPIGGFGLMTQSGNFGSLLATAFRIDVTSGDGFYAVSEFQAIGQAVPEPATLTLFGTGFAAAVARRRRQAKG
jgi:hypothetical protein